MTTTTNELINETSPYLLQHAHNPVHWMPWGKKALNKAQQENKLLLISIGYSACHWCHVMEHESFEDNEVATIMNANFVCIKVDREERPDVDQVYMNAIQLMNGNGGWPLNMVALPDGRPLWGGTYVPKVRWMGILEQLSQVYLQKPDEVLAYAEDIAMGMNQFEPRLTPTHLDKYEPHFIKQIVEKWATSFDTTYGGEQRAPKFPLPANLEFLLNYGWIHQDKKVLDHVILTLDRMSFGGIYDHLEGGFARYSTDARWHVPHFEKMLYDNAQLVSLYAKAYRAFGYKRYLNVIEQTIEFIRSRWLSPEGSVFSALDADSEGVEGKYYVWTESELQGLLGQEYTLFSAYYSINPTGHWEHGNYVLLKNMTDEEFALEHHLELDQLESQVQKWTSILLPYRNMRISPQLDDKTLTSWNALMITGFVHAWEATNKKEYLEMALQIGQFIVDKMHDTKGQLYHSYKMGQSSVSGHLDDYAFTISAFLGLYRASLDEFWLERAQELLVITEQCFLNSITGLYYFTSSQDDPLFDRATDIHDNVLPSGNAVMAKNLHEISLLTGNRELYEKALKMTTDVVNSATTYPSGYTTWLNLLMIFQQKSIEVVVAGENAQEVLHKIRKKYNPAIYLIGCQHASQYSIFLDRFIESQLNIYLCIDGSCQLPFHCAEDLVSELMQNAELTNYSN